MMSGSYGNYEFNDMENQIIDKTRVARSCGNHLHDHRRAPVFASCGAVANASMASYLPSGIIAIVIGVTFMVSAARSRWSSRPRQRPHAHDAGAPEDGQRLHGPDRLRDHRIRRGWLIFMLAASCSSPPRRRSKRSDA